MKKTTLIIALLLVFYTCYTNQPVQKLNKLYINTANEYVTFFLVKIPDDLSGDFSSHFVAVDVKIDSKQKLTNEDKIASALKALFKIKSFEYGENDLQNPLYLSTLDVGSITKSSEITTIDLKGVIMGIGSGIDGYIQMQIEMTIGQYADKYMITLNNSEKEWRCALDESGMCE